jgi:hypothetical protein
MWASAEGGTPEVTLETSMGPFTVEVLFSVWLLRKRFKVKDNITPSVFFIFRTLFCLASMNASGS